MNFPQLWKESGIDPESDKAAAVRIIIEALLEWECDKIAYSFSRHQTMVEYNTGLSWNRVKEILKSDFIPEGEE